MFTRNSLSGVLLCAIISVLSVWPAFVETATALDGGAGRSDGQGDYISFALMEGIGPAGNEPKIQDAPSPPTLPVVPATPTITLVANPSTIKVSEMTIITVYALHGNAQPAAGVTLFFGSSGAGDAGDFEYYRGEQSAFQTNYHLPSPFAGFDCQVHDLESCHAAGWRPIRLFRHRH